MSAQIRKERKQYYTILEKTQKGSLEITEWIQRFLSCLIAALRSTDVTLNRVIYKADFWVRHAATGMKDRKHY